MGARHRPAFLLYNQRQLPKQVIHDKLGTIPTKSKSILFTNSDLNIALKSLNRGKACGADGLAA